MKMYSKSNGREGSIYGDGEIKGRGVEGMR